MKGRPRKYCVNCKEEKNILAMKMCSKCYTRDLKQRRINRTFNEYMAMSKSIDKSMRILEKRKDDLQKLVTKQRKLITMATKQIAIIEVVLRDEGAINPSLLRADGPIA